MRTLIIRLLEALCFLHFFLIPNQSTCQTFACDGRIYITQHNGNPPTSLFEVIESNGSFRFDLVTRYSNVVLNAVGYNSIDNFIYGVGNNGRFYRLYKNGNFENIGYAGHAANTSVVAGDVNLRGEQVAYNNRTGRIHIYQVTNGFSEVANTSIYWNNQSGNSGYANIRIGDIVIHPYLPNTIIAYQHYDQNPVNTRGYILFINIDPNSSDFGEVTPQFNIPSNVANVFGGFFFDKEGRLLGFSGVNGPGQQQNRVVEIDLQNEEASLLAIGSSASGVDGCSCPIALDLKKTVDTVVTYCDSSFIYYTLCLINNGISNYFDLEIFDVLEPGGRIVSFEDTIQATSFEIRNNDTRLDIDVKELASFDSICMSISVKVDNSNFPYSNQAFLGGIAPDNLLIIPSDDPKTPKEDDETLADIEYYQDTTIIELSTSICYGDTIEIYNRQFYSAITDTINISSIGFCDSLLIVDIDVLDTSLTYLTYSRCFLDTIMYNGHEIIRDGVYYYMDTNRDGCDSTVILRVETTDTIKINIDTSICPTDTLLFKGHSLNAPGQYTLHSKTEECDTLWHLSINHFAPPSIQVESINSCPNESSGEIWVLPEDISQDFQILWNDNNQDWSRTNLSKGTYSFQVIDDNQCKYSFNVEVLEEVLPEINFQVQPADCHNDFQGRLIITNANGAHSFSVHQNPLLGDSAIVLDGPAIYHLKYLFEHCPADTFFESTIIDTLQLAFDKDVVSDCGALVEINARVLNADQNAIASFELIGVDSFEQSAHDLHISFRAYHSQTVHAVVVDTHGCQYIRPISIDIDGEDHLFIPNVFTPNGDNINDEFHIYGSPCIQQINKFQIFDRWGEMVFAAYDFLPEEKGWNGRLNFEKMRPGAYTYYVVYESYAGGSFQRTGSVTILE